MGSVGRIKDKQESSPAIKTSLQLLLTLPFVTHVVVDCPVWMLSARAHRCTFTLYSAAASVSSIGFHGSFLETNLNRKLKHERDIQTAATGNITASGQRHEGLWAFDTPLHPFLPTTKPNLCPCVFAAMSKTVS